SCSCGGRAGQRGSPHARKGGKEGRLGGGGPHPPEGGRAAGPARPGGGGRGATSGRAMRPVRCSSTMPNGWSRSLIASSLLGAPATMIVSASAPTVSLSASPHAASLVHAE